jgi:hypothetical protein
VLVKSKNFAEVAQADGLLDKISQLEQEARRLGLRSEDAGDFRGAMGAVRELVRIVELLAKLQKTERAVRDPTTWSCADWSAWLQEQEARTGVPVEVVRQELEAEKAN